MPELEFAIAEQGRPTYGLPTTRQVNAFVEATPAGPKKAARISRPGLTLWNTVGTGPILRIYQNPGIFLGDPFIVSNGEFFRGTTSLGTVPFSYQPRMAATIEQLALVVGGALFVYDGTALTAVPYFDDGFSVLPPFSGVAVLFNIFIYPVAGTTQFYWSKPGDATSINALNFASATTTPDPIIEAVTLSDELYFIKQANGTEIWDYNPIVDPTSGQITQPFQLSQGRTWIRGSPAQGSVVPKIDNAIIWVGDDLEVYRSGPVPQNISTPFINDRLRAAKDTIDQTFSFSLGIEGHWFYVMNLGGLGETHVYDCAASAVFQQPIWDQWGSQATLLSEPGLFIGDCAAGQGATIYVGDQHSNNVWLLDVAANDDAGEARAVVVSAAIWVPSGTKRLNNVSLACVRGGGSETDNPSVWMNISYDGGRTFTSWMEGNLGFQGQYSYKAVWRNLGVIQQPGVLLTFQVLDSVPFVVSGGAFNVPRA